MNIIIIIIIIITTATTTINTKLNFICYVVDSYLCIDDVILIK